MTYYSANNIIADKTSSGFISGWYVKAWSTKASRDAYLASCVDMVSQPLDEDEVLDFLNNLAAEVHKRQDAEKSTEFTIIDFLLDLTNIPEGFIGQVILT